MSYKGFNKSVSVRGKTLDQIGIETMKTTVESEQVKRGKYRAVLEVPSDNVSSSDRSGYVDVHIDLPVGELDLSSIRAQLEGHYPNSVIEYVLDGVSEAIDNVLVPIEIAKLRKS